MSDSVSIIKRYDHLGVKLQTLLEVKISEICVKTKHDDSESIVELYEPTLVFQDSNNLRISFTLDEINHVESFFLSCKDLIPLQKGQQSGFSKSSVGFANKYDEDRKIKANKKFSKTSRIKLKSNNKTVAWISYNEFVILRNKIDNPVKAVEDILLTIEKIRDLK